MCSHLLWSPGSGMAWLTFKFLCLWIADIDHCAKTHNLAAWVVKTGWPSRLSYSDWMSSRPMFLCTPSRVQRQEMCCQPSNPQGGMSLYRQKTCTSHTAFKYLLWKMLQLVLGACLDPLLGTAGPWLAREGPTSSEASVPFHSHQFSLLELSKKVMWFSPPLEYSQGQIFFLFYFIFCFLFQGCVCGMWSSQARGQIRAAAAGPRHSHSNARFELCLQPTLQLSAMLDS